VNVYKYKPFNMHALHLLLRDELYLADAQTELNDPVDCVLIYKGERYPLKASVFSLSETNNNFAMWSQYAEGHRGLCYELSFDAIEKAIETKNSDVQQRRLIVFERVKYLDPTEFKVALADAISEAPYDSLVVDHEKVVLLKINTFAHEKEIRIATKSLDWRQTLLVPRVVVGVYMGMDMPESDRCMLEAIVDMVNETQDRQIKKFKATTVDEHYRVTFEAVG